VCFSVRLLNRNRETLQPIRSHGKGNGINRMTVILMMDRYDYLWKFYLMRKSETSTFDCENRMVCLDSLVISYFFHLLLSSSFICFAIPNAQAVCWRS
jgi:hypothetical protein